MKQLKSGSMFALIVSVMLFAAAGSTTAVASDSAAADGADTAAHIEELTRSYFLHLGKFELDEMRNMSTPEFEIFEHDGSRAMRMNLEAFDQRLRGAQEAGAQIRFEPGNFTTTVTSSGAWTFYIEKGLIPSNQDKRFYGTTIWKKVGDRWLLDKMVSMPIPEGSPNFPE